MRKSGDFHLYWACDRTNVSTIPLATIVNTYGSNKKRYERAVSLSLEHHSLNPYIESENLHGFNSRLSLILWLPALGRHDFWSC